MGIETLRTLSYVEANYNELPAVEQLITDLPRVGWTKKA